MSRASSSSSAPHAGSPTINGHQGSRRSRWSALRAHQALPTPGRARPSSPSVAVRSSSSSATDSIAARAKSQSDGWQSSACVRIVDVPQAPAGLLSWARVGQVSRPAGARGSSSSGTRTTAMPRTGPSAAAGPRNRCRKVVARPNATLGLATTLRGSRRRSARAATTRGARGRSRSPTWSR